MQDIIQLAVQFVERHATETERARMAYILDGTKPSREQIARLFVGQRADGGWPAPWAPDLSSVDATCYRLAQAEQLGIRLDYPAVQQGCWFLAKQQAEDGRIEEYEVAAELAPPWAAPGSLDAALYLTANAGFWLANCCDNRPAAQKAAEFLLPHVCEGKLPSFLHTHWLAAGLFFQTGYAEVGEQIGIYLARKINVDTPSSSLAWLGTTLLAAGFPANIPLIMQVRSLLALAQEADGRWRNADSPANDMHTTLEALRVFCAEPRKTASAQSSVYIW